jgi:hypothetical protein
MISDRFGNFTKPIGRLFVSGSVLYFQRSSTFGMSEVIFLMNRSRGHQAGGFRRPWAGAFLVIALALPLTLLCVPLVPLGGEKDVCGDLHKRCEELLQLARPRRLTPRDTHPAFHPSRMGRICVPCVPSPRPPDFLSGHRLKHDLMAPLVC